ncbi:zinc ribbon domain-containing protein [Paenibacillus sp. IHBB 10380]|uniref:zinc ribbon domain-containing protein n=1 Tax=Paenibacillus sp. IHBB 10380 TaxID=1566358 RepID=UPI0009E30604|nr:zinc ribbon domain-containing protein [Paenibacillus sp. IHBB 10380]
MSFFDKLKSGVSEAGNKAKVAVEINRLKMQNSSKHKEIDQQYQEIGRSVFLSLTNEDESISLDKLQPFIQQILTLQDEIQRNQAQIGLAGDEKKCVCGEKVPMETRFCPICGHPFEVIDIG